MRAQWLDTHTVVSYHNTIHTQLYTYKAFTLECYQIGMGDFDYDYCKANITFIINM